MFPHSLSALFLYALAFEAYALCVNPRIFNPNLETREDADQLCGVQNNNTSCTKDFCCSQDGHCGKTRHYCDAPQCQFRYGPACDANEVPNGTTTLNTPRPHFGNLAYGGVGYHNCTAPGTVALTFDDGPYTYTSHLLDILKKRNVKATFFVTSVSRGKHGFDDKDTVYGEDLLRMYADGHQIGSHSWSHADLSNLTSGERDQEIVKNEMAFRNLFGFFPTYMRPPYGDCTSASGCTETMSKLGYHIIYWNMYTQDLKNSSPELIQQSKNSVSNVLQVNGCEAPTSSHILYSHDTDYQTIYNLTDFMIDEIVSNGYRAVTIGECLSDPSENWYRNATTGEPLAPKET
ncbi:hypothetical protein N7540_002290 [Penicillium herquei]|nr:hypothetical protein N7540_002290 [Penicillium herquei]